jgi:hypothetical protein
VPLVPPDRPHLLDIVDETFIAADPPRIRAATCDPNRWADWFPGACLTSYDDRGSRGERWLVSGSLVGTAEVWLEEHGDGAIVHAYLRANPAAPGLIRGRAARRRFVTGHALTLKRAMFGLKDLLEGVRVPGTARVPLRERVVSASEQRPSGTSTEGTSRDGRPDDVQHRDRR